MRNKDPRLEESTNRQERALQNKLHGILREEGVYELCYYAVANDLNPDEKQAFNS